jgi:hypothetical protein
MTKLGEAAIGVHVGVVEVGQGIKLGRGETVAVGVIVGRGVTVKVLSKGATVCEGVA